jgi:hypothetical protein
MPRSGFNFDLKGKSAEVSCYAIYLYKGIKRILLVRVDT